MLLFTMVEEEDMERLEKIPKEEWTPEERERMEEYDARAKWADEMIDSGILS